MSWYQQSVDQYAVRVTYDVNNRIEYVGEAHPKNQNKTQGTYWRIKKLIYDGAGNLIATLWANRDSRFIYSWDSRASYAY